MFATKTDTALVPTDIVCYMDMVIVFCPVNGFGILKRGNLG